MVLLVTRGSAGTLEPQLSGPGKLAKRRNPNSAWAGLVSQRDPPPHIPQRVTSAAAPTIRMKRGTTSSALSRAHQSMSASMP